MKLQSLLFVLFLAAVSCKNNFSNVPQTLSHKALTGKFTTGSGSYAALIGKSFTITFINNGQFKSHAEYATSEDSGTYIYDLAPKNQAILSFTVNSGENQGEQVDVTLEFSSKSGGKFHGLTAKGGAGSFTGTFTLADQS